MTIIAHRIAVDPALGEYVKLFRWVSPSGNMHFSPWGIRFIVAPNRMDSPFIQMNALVEAP